MIKTVGIYSIESPSRKGYIGQSWNIEKRFNWYSNHDAKEQPHLCNSFKKYGFDAHEFKILHELPPDVTQEVLDRYEQIYIDAYRDAGIELMNLKEGGRGGKHCEETKKKISEKIKGRTYSDEHRKNISLAQTGRKNTPERIRNVIEAKRKNGFAVSDQARENYRKAQTGRKHSEGSRQKLSIALKGLKRTDETKEKLSEVRKNWWEKQNEGYIKNRVAGLAKINSKKVIQMSLTGEFIKEWASSAEVERELGVHISGCLGGRYKHSGGFKWQYK